MNIIYLDESLKKRNEQVHLKKIKVIAFNECGGSQ